MKRDGKLGNQFRIFARELEKLVLVLREARDVGVEPWDQCRAGLGGGRRRGLNGHKTRTVGGEHDVFEPHLKRTGKAPAGIRAHFDIAILNRSEEHTSDLQSLMRISYAVF